MAFSGYNTNGVEDRLVNETEGAEIVALVTRLDNELDRAKSEIRSKEILLEEVTATADRVISDLKDSLAGERSSLMAVAAEVLDLKARLADAQDIISRIQT